MKRLVTTFVLILSCAAFGPAQSRNKRRTPAPPSPSLIAENTAPGVQWALGLVDGPYYGDLTGDRREEVAFVLRYGQVGAPGTAEARVYTLRDGQPALLVTLPVADGVTCQLDHYIKIEDGMLSVERLYGGGRRCDHTEVTQYRWDGRGLTPVGAPARGQCRCITF